MKRRRRHLFSFLTDLAIRSKGGRSDEQDLAQRRAQMSFETNVARWPLRMTSFLRDRLRRRWLRMVRGGR